MYRCENWTIKKAEHWRIDAFELWCWTRPLSIPWTARRSNQSILKEISPEYSVEAEKAMAPHSTLAWKMPWTEEPGRLQSMGSRRVGHDWETSLSLFTFMHWRRKWQPTPVFLPGESQGWGSLVGCHLWGCRVRQDWSDLAAAAFSGRTDAEAENSNGHLMRRANSLEKALMLGKTEGRRRRGGKGPDGWTASPTQWTWGVWASSSRQWRVGSPGVLQSMGWQSVRHDLATEQHWHFLISIFSEGE